MKYLKGYSQDLQDKVRQVVSQGLLADGLRSRYPSGHGVRTDKALYDYVLGLKNQYIRNGAPISKVTFDSKIQVIAHALGTHATVSRVQGKNLKSKREIRIATLFRAAPEEFLRMIAVHELAHLKESDHNKSFYQLCLHMEPNYYQYEFDVRLYLTHLDQPGGAGLWDA
ncbi:M48 family metallopeptidase [Alcaligenaceae bacterium]|nr:M48 family metallopeptidase [Alcaligenaceae bacterium]